MIEKYRNVNYNTAKLSFIIIAILCFFYGSTGFAAGSGLNNDKSKIKSTLSKSINGPTSQRILVRFKTGVSNSSKNSLHKALGTRLKKSFKITPEVQVIEIGQGKSVEKILQEYQKDPNVVYAEIDQIIHLKATTPNDISYSQLWALNNTGQSGGLSNADINAPEAWDISQGSNDVVVAVLDTGIDYTHGDLVDNIWTNPGEIPGNGIDDDNNSYIDDIHGIDTGDNDTDPMDIEGHGSHVAGTIGARGNNNLGVVGVNWNVSIIACKIFSLSTSQDIEAFASDAAECLDYLADLKVNHGVNIVATNNSWGWIGTPSQTLMDAIDRQRQAGILFVAAAGNDALDNDRYLDNPSSYYYPNVISVAASTDSDTLAFFSNYGKRSVHVAAPGVDILSTILYDGFGGYLPPVQNPHSQVFFDNVESGSGGWSADGTWNITTAESFSTSHSWTDSSIGNYSNSSNMSLTSSTVNLGSYFGQTLYLGFYAKYDLETYFDFVHVEITTDSVNWFELETLTGISSGWEFFSLQIPSTYVKGSFRVRFRLESDFTVNRDGIYIDDIGIGTTPFTPTASSGPYRYDSYSGTSMASPHVVGLLALLKAQNPARTWSELKNLVMSSGKPISGLQSNTVSGRRISAFNTDNTGAMSCSNQTVLSRLQPRNYSYGFEGGQTANISMMHVNCDQPAGDVTVTIQETGDVITLLDNGLNYDQVAGDGVYSADINLADFGRETATIQFPDSSEVYARTVYNYQPATPNTFQWRDVSAIGQPVVAGDDEIGYIEAPFDINFGNNTSPFTKLAITTNGYLVMQRIGDPVIEISIFENQKIPSSLLSNIVAPFWDDLVVDSATNLIWGVTGVAPNRELVVTWQNVHAFGGVLGISFQVVFKENSPDIIMNYLDVNARISGFDRGASATVGVQVSDSIGQQFSYNTAALNDGLSLRWVMQDGVANTPELPPPAVPPANLPPVADAGITQSVNQNDLVTLNGSGSDSDGTITSYSWQQITGIPVTLNNSNTQTPTFTAPSVTNVTVLTFELTVTDNGGAIGTDQVVIVVNNPNTGGGGSSFGGGGSSGIGSFDYMIILLLPFFVVRRFRKTYKKH